ncbi:MAG: hypothetical protein JWP35_1869 [Caulobacter sp.]|nr:hypothetical protein [Caulobacter sp.]
MEVSRCPLRGRSYWKGPKTRPSFFVTFVTFVPSWSIFTASDMFSARGAESRNVLRLDP